MTTIQTAPEAKPDASRIEFVVPRGDLHQDPDGFTLDIEMPGVGKDGVEITFDDGKLTLVGHRAKPTSARRPVYTEFGNRHYRRIFDLDPSIDAGKISASIDQGLLTVHLPKAETSKPRKIAVS